MDRTQLLVKNIPKLTPNLENSFKTAYGAIDVKTFGRCRAVLKFPDERCANSALQYLHQTELCGRTISAEYFGTQKQPPIIQNEPESESQPRVSDFLRNLYATNSPHGFEQPPPPHLKYNYPPINRTILDSISIALLTNPRFYHQVLHLMNRMNLDPPFLPLKKPFVTPGEPCDAQTQTEVEHDPSNLLASDESELESDNESRTIKRNANRKRRKPPPPNEQLIKNKMRKIISAQLHEKSQPAAAHVRKEDNNLPMFEETNALRNFGKKIALNVAAVKLPEPSHSQPLEVADDCDTTKSTPLVGDELRLNRISEAQQKDLPIFKNYQRGDKSNKLYVKNLSKDVTEEDLVSVYSRFLGSSSENISVKLMLFGKMKGQAFVTFNNLKDDKLDAVELALNETNGFILKNKPMVVCFGKRS